MKNVNKRRAQLHGILAMLARFILFFSHQIYAHYEREAIAKHLCILYSMLKRQISCRLLLAQQPALRARPDPSPVGASEGFRVTRSWTPSSAGVRKWFHFGLPLDPYKKKVGAASCGPCLVLPNTRRGWANVPPLGREAAPLARCSPPTALTTLGPACCAGHFHPSSPFALSGSSVGQRGILRSIHLLSCTCNTR